MKHLKQAINLMSQKYRPWWDQKKIEQLQEKINYITDYGEKTEDDLTTEELYEIYELEDSIRQHERNIKTKGEDFF